MKLIPVFFIFISTLVLTQSVRQDDDRYMHPHFPTPVINKFKTQLKNEESADYWIEIGRDITKKHKQTYRNENSAKNIIFFLGDGMSLPTLAATRIYMGQMEGKPGEEYELSFDKFPISGMSKTYCVDSQVSDSACAATAFLSGVKGNYGTIGVTAAVSVGDCEKNQDKDLHTSSIAKWFLDSGRKAGIITTTRVTHPTPAGAYAHVADGYWESDTDVLDTGSDPKICPDVAYQMMHGDPGNRLNVILGGGRAEFLSKDIIDEEGVAGYRTDDLNLIEDWMKLRQNNGDSYEYIWNKTDLLKVSENTDYLLGLFENSHCKYHLDANPETEPTLAEMVEAGIKVLSKGGDGYFLFVEGGRIDHAHHDTRARYVLDETAELSKAVAKAVELTSTDDTLIVVTADHGSVMTLNGYPTRGNPILDKVDRDLGADGIPYLTLSYANGPGYRKEVDGSRVDVTKEDMESSSFMNPSMVPLSAQAHGGEDVGVYALGPQQQLFSGVYEQNAIPIIMAYASCIDKDFSVCNDDKK